MAVFFGAGVFVAQSCLTSENLNFQSREVVSRYRDSQLQVTKFK